MASLVALRGRDVGRRLDAPRGLIDAGVLGQVHARPNYLSQLRYPPWLPLSAAGISWSLDRRATDVRGSADQRLGEARWRLGTQSAVNDGAGRILPTRPYRSRRSTIGARR